MGKDFLDGDVGVSNDRILQRDAGYFVEFVEVGIFDGLLNVLLQGAEALVLVGFFLAFIAIMSGVADVEDDWTRWRLDVEGSGIRDEKASGIRHGEEEVSKARASFRCSD